MATGIPDSEYLGKIHSGQTNLITLPVPAPNQEGDVLVVLSWPRASHQGLLVVTVDP